MKTAIIFSRCSSSGGMANKDKPILQEALSFSQDNHIDIILVSELSRLGI